MTVALRNKRTRGRDCWELQHLLDLPGGQMVELLPGWCAWPPPHVSHHMPDVEGRVGGVGHLTGMMTVLAASRYYPGLTRTTKAVVDRSSLLHPGDQGVCPAASGEARVIAEHGTRAIVGDCQKGSKKAPWKAFFILPCNIEI